MKPSKKRNKIKNKIKKATNVQDRIKIRAKHYGNKAANLIELDSLCSTIKNKKININIPEIFPIDDLSIQHHLDEYAPKWRQLWEQFIILQNNQKTLTNEGKLTLKSLRDLITECFRERSFCPEILAPSDSLFMVRSSGDEDRVEIANPGGNKSVAAVKLDAWSMSNAIGTVVASYFSEKSLTQRLLSGDDIQQPFMPVLIQKMIGEKLNGFDDPKQRVISGVMYAKQSGITRLDAAFGHGEIIVNSKAPFDTFEVTDDDIVHAAIHQKKSRLVPTEIKNDNNDVERKLIFKENPKKLQEAPSVTPEVAAEIAHVGRHIANHYGMPMDIEWVFTPETQTLSIVQARPIPQSVKHKISPSTISPEKWKRFKSDPEIQLSKTPVISPAGNEAKIVKSETTILAGNIASAHSVYLKKSEQKHVDAVVVKEPAPSTSHEAAQFNLMGVPVYQGAIESIDRWLKEEKSVVIADTQHQHFVNMTNINKKRQIDDENTLRDEKTIVDGMYTSSLSTSKTLLPGSIIENELIKAGIMKYLSNNKNIGSAFSSADMNMIYSTLVNCIETIESAKINDKNIEAFDALQNIADIFKIMSTSSKGQDKAEPHQKLFVHAMLSIAEIDHCLSEFSKLTEINDQQKAKQQQQLLDLISKLKALVINPGEPNLYSDSIYQLALQSKTLQESKIDSSKMSDSQRSYFTEFLKLKALALNEDTQRIWAEFAYDCAQTLVARQKLSKIIMFAVENNMLSELVNNLFVNAIKNKKPNEKVIVKLYELVDQNRYEFWRHHIAETNQLLLAWENRINDWSSPQKFERLLKDFDLELNPLISNLYLNTYMSNLTQQIILKQAERLTEVIDKSIKAMKSSMEYQGQETLLVERFAKLLSYYYRLMDEWMTAVPYTFYDQCAAKIRTDKAYNNKSSMLTAIERGFSDKKQRRDLKQLNASGYLNVASAKAGSNASFERQFVQQRDLFTLEDYFTLFHQNILASIAELNKKSMLPCTSLPKIIQPLVDEIQKANNVSLLHVMHRHPIIELEFNLPLDNHSAKFTFEFNTRTKSLMVNGRFFGMNWEYRMDLIAKMSEIEGLLLGDILQKPSYNKDNRSLEFNWKFSADRIPYLAQHIKDIVNHYATMTENSYGTIRRNCRQLWERHCVDLCISDDISKQLPSERRKKIGDEIAAIDKSILAKSLLRNPDLLLSFINGDLDVFIEDIYEVLPKLSFMLLERFINNCALSPNIIMQRSHTINGRIETLLTRLISTWDAEEAIKFLEKYQPDLAPHASIFKNVKDNNPKIFEYLFANKAPFDFDDIKYAFEHPEIKPYAIAALEKWDTTRLSNWVYANSSKASYSFSNRDCLLNVIDHFKNEIDLNYKPLGAVDTLFEHLIQTPFFTNMTEVKFNEFLNKNNIDISQHPKFLRLLLLHEHSLGICFLKKSIAEHVLDPMMMHCLRHGEATSLLSGWSVVELKSWMDNHAEQLGSVELNEVKSLYFSKLAQTLEPVLPKGAPLTLTNVLNCFNNLEIQSELIDIFKQWRSEDIASWLIESTALLKTESFPELLQFIELTKADLNKVEEVAGDEFSLLECIVPLLNDKMPKQDIEKFINDNNVDVTKHPDVLAHALSMKCYVLADILVDKGMSFLAIHKYVFSGLSSIKDAQPILSKAFMKLSGEQRTEFLYDRVGDDFCAQLMLNSLDALNFQYSEDGHETLFFTAMRIFDDEQLVNLVKAGLVDLTKNDEISTGYALTVALVHKRYGLAWLMLESKANNHSLNKADFIKVKDEYPVEQLLSLFKDWKQNEFKEWIAKTDIPSYIKTPIEELYKSKQQKSPLQEGSMFKSTNVNNDDTIQKVNSVSNIM